MNKYKAQLRAVDSEMQTAVKAAKALTQTASDEGRELSDDEREQVDTYLTTVDTLKGKKVEIEDAIAVNDRVEELGRNLKVEEEEKPTPRAKTLGEQFVQSKGYQTIKANGLRGAWSSGQVELEGKDDTILVEGTNDSPGAGGALVPIEVQPGVVQTLFQALTIGDLLGSGSTSSNALRYVVETVATSGADTVDEGDDKPQSILEFDTVDESVKKIATFLPISDEMLEDAAQIQSYINSRLVLFVRQKEEDELLNGGGGSDISGLLNRVPGGNQGVVSDADAPNAADHIFAAITKVRTGSFLEPDGVIINSDDWAELRLVKDTTENYIGGSPFSNTGSNPSDSLWGKRVVVTSAITAGTALVGAFSTAAQVYRRGGLTVEASNSHADYFVKNLTAIRAEERLALAVYRPQAFATADLTGGS